MNPSPTSRITLLELVMAEAGAGVGRLGIAMPATRVVYACLKLLGDPKPAYHPEPIPEAVR